MPRIVVDGGGGGGELPPMPGGGFVYEPSLLMIVNNALAKISRAGLTELDEDSFEATQARLFLPQVMARAMSTQDWGFNNFTLKMHYDRVSDPAVYGLSDTYRSYGVTPLEINTITGIRGIAGDEYVEWQEVRGILFIESEEEALYIDHRQILDYTSTGFFKNLCLSADSFVEYAGDKLALYLDGAINGTKNGDRIEAISSMKLAIDRDERTQRRRTLRIAHQDYRGQGIR